MQSLQEVFIRHGLRIQEDNFIRASRPKRKKPKVETSAWVAIGKAADAAKAFFELLADKYPSGTLSLNIGQKIIHVCKSDSPEKLEHELEVQKGLQIDLKIDP